MPEQIQTPASAATLAKDPAAEQASTSDISLTKHINTQANLYSSFYDVTFEFLVDKVSFKDEPKPTGQIMSCIRKRLEDPDSHAIVSIEELGSYLANGYTIMPSVCLGGTKKEHWQRQQLFFLDFDNDDAMSQRGFKLLEPLDALHRAFDLGLDPLFLYFSHSASIDPYVPKYRMIFGLSQPSSDRTHIESIGKALLDIFPEADPASTRFTQMFLSPGKEVWECWKEL